MGRLTANQIVQSLVVALAVAGIGYGVALGFSSADGISALWTATFLAFFSMLAGLLLSGGLRDIGNRPAGAPSAFRAGYGTSLFLMVFSIAPVLLIDLAAPWPFLVVLGMHILAQSALAWFVFRRADPTEMAADGS